ncbi:MAG: trypsin-like peptidase domain-containing protein [Canibacter sp.]
MSNSFGSGNDAQDQTRNGQSADANRPQRAHSEQSDLGSPEQQAPQPRYSQPPQGWGSRTPDEQMSPGQVAQNMTRQAREQQNPPFEQDPQYRRSQPPQYAPPVHPANEQPTAQYPQHPAQGGSIPNYTPQQHGVAGPQGPAGPEGPHHNLSSSGGQPDKKKSGKTGVLLGGLAIGALIGGLVGGGSAALVLANSDNDSVSATSSQSGQIELKNTETVTAVSAIAQARTPSVVTLEVAGSSGQGSGSGVIYSKDGYIITNAHVVTLEGAAGDDPTIRARMSDGQILNAKVVGVDPYADLAVVKVDGEDLPTIDLADSSSVNVGDLTVAIGAPLNLSSTVTSGVISATNRGITVGSAQVPDDEGGDDQPDEDSPFRFPWDFQTPDDGQEPEQPQQPQQSTGGQVTLPVLQTDASINPGNSGGALLNGDGDLIGINVAIASTGTQETAGSVGLGFAIPSNLVKRVADDLIAGETPSHGLLGASVGDASSNAEASHAGGMIAEVQPNSPAEKAGLKKGDVITAIDGVGAADGTSVSALIRMHEGGSDVEISYNRDGKTQTVDITLDTLEQ